MAHFYGQIEGRARTLASRLGTKKSGLWGHLRGWNIGCKVVLRYDAETGEDVVEVYITSGSNDQKPGKLLGIFRESEF